MPPRQTDPRRWRTLLLASAAAGTAIVTVAPHMAQAADTGQGRIWLAAGATTEGGEGGESGSAVTADASVELLTKLGLIEGHLRVGMALHRDGHHDMATTHSKHPRDEIYTDLAEKLADRGLDGFADELTALSAAIADNAPADAAFDAVLARLAALRSAINEPPREVLEAMEHMVRTAADEYALGVKDGTITDMHEYQDAWGFLQAAREQALILQAFDDPAVQKAAQTALDALAETDAAFAGVAPDGPVPGSADILYGAAARIEFAALSLK